MIRILLVEDDPVIRDTTSYFLKCQQNFEVVCADTGGEALSHAREKFDVILMDILLPDTNGMDLCQRLRSWHHCPIIFTSCLDDTDTVVRALELGGDDFLTKPYNHKVLLARIMANIRRVQMDAAEPSVSGYHCVAFTLDSNSHCVEKDGRSIHLADMEYRILTLFIRHPNTFFTANELYRKIWGKESLGMSALCRCISITSAVRSSPTLQSPSTSKISGAKAIFSARKGRRRPEMVLLS